LKICGGLADCAISEIARLWGNRAAQTFLLSTQFLSFTAADRRFSDP
jgi:hypothetical protein